MGFLSTWRPQLLAAKPIKQSGGGPVPSQESLRAPAELVRAAVAAIPNTTDLFPSRDDFIQVGYAIKAAVADEAEALDIFGEWCARWDMGLNDPDKIENEWRRMPGPYKRGANWLFELAQDYGGYQRGAEWFDGEAAMQAVKAERETLTAAAALFRFEPFNDVAEFALSDVAAALVKGLLDLGAMSVMYGASNTGKSFLAMMLAYYIASGRAWAGMKVTRSGVAYIVGEGARGIGRRAAALRAKYGPCDGFNLLRSGVNLFDAGADLEPLIVAIQGLGGVGFIVIDTLARAMAGGDENSTKDMSAFVKNIDRLRAATGAHVMLVHHSGKVAANGARGSSALRAATDTEIEIADGQFAVTKQRDLDKSFSCAFALDEVELRRDQDGDRIVSCTVRLTVGDTAATTISSRPSKAESDVLGALAAVYAEAGAPAEGVNYKGVADYMADRLLPIKPDGVRFQLRALLAKQLVNRLARGKWAPKSGENGVSAFSPRRKEAFSANFANDDAMPELPRRKSGESIFD